jgi:hypothetical protein
MTEKLKYAVQVSVFVYSVQTLTIASQVLDEVMKEQTNVHNS